MLLLTEHREVRPFSKLNLSSACKQHMPFGCLRLSKALRVGSPANMPTTLIKHLPEN